MESWRKAFRDGIAPLLSDAALSALATALEIDDPRLVQAWTTMPSPSPSVQQWPVKAACAIGFAGWQGHQLVTVGAVEDYFCKLCMECDFTLGEPAGVRWFLTWFDETPRDLMRRLLLAEVNVELATRRQPAASGDAA
jgi:hypothetical protein